MNRLKDIGGAFLRLDALVDPLFDEDPLQRPIVHLPQQLLLLQLQLRLEHHLEVVGVEGEDFADPHDRGNVVFDHERVGADSSFTIRICIEGVDDILGVGVSSEVDLDVHALGGEIVDRTDLEAAFLRRIFN